MMERPHQLVLQAEDAKSAAKTLVTLQTPDLLTLPQSPELERILQQLQAHAGGPITAVKTPTQTQILFPKRITEDQEAYAKGFMDALQKIKDQGSPTKFESTTSTTATSITNTTPTPILTAGAAAIVWPGMMKEEPQIVPSASVGLMPSQFYQLPQFAVSQTQPITQAQMIKGEAAPLLQMMQSQHQHSRASNMQQQAQIPSRSVDLCEQEQMKLERKRERNRVAARNCRSRKLARIQELQEKMAELNKYNSDLVDQIKQTSGQIGELREKIIEHRDNGCCIKIPDDAMAVPFQN